MCPCLMLCDHTCLDCSSYDSRQHLYSVYEDPAEPASWEPTESRKFYGGIRSYTMGDSFFLITLYICFLRSHRQCSTSGLHDIDVDGRRKRSVRNGSPVEQPSSARGLFHRTGRAYRQVNFISQTFLDSGARVRKAVIPHSVIFYRGKYLPYCPASLIKRDFITKINILIFYFY